MKDSVLEGKNQSENVNIIFTFEEEGKTNTEDILPLIPLILAETSTILIDLHALYGNLVYLRQEHYSAAAKERILSNL